MHKIKKISALFRILFQLLFILIPLMLMIGWINAPNPIFFHGFSFEIIPESIAGMIKHPLSTTTKWRGFIISLIPNGLHLLVLYFLIKLFRLYEKAEIFSIKNVKYIRNIGYALLIGQLLNPIYQLLLSATLTWDNPPGQRFMTISLSGTNLGLILMGLMIILISWIMAEGCKLREEQIYTI